MQYEKEEMEKAYADLYENERPILAFISALIGYIPASLILFVLNNKFILGLLFATIACPAMIGFFARFVGRLFSTKAKMAIAIFVGIIYIGWGIEGSATPLWYFLTPVPIAIAYLSSGRKLSRLQQFAIAEYNIGKLTHEKEKPVISFIKYTGFLGSVVVIALLYFGVYLHASNSCLISIEARNSELAMQTCFSENDLSGNDLVNQSAYFQDHEFGNYFDRSQAGTLVEDAAMAGDPEFQFLWWFILQNIYLDDISITNNQAREKLNTDAEKWLAESADSGSVNAMKVFIYQHTTATISTDEKKARAIDYARHLIELGVPVEENTLEIAENIPSKEEIRREYQKRLQDYSQLNPEQLDNLVYALEEGYFYFTLNEFQTESSEKGSYQQEISVAKDPDKIPAILQHMVSEYREPNAAYRLFQEWIPKDPEKGLEYLRIAAAGNHPEATEKFGKHLFCNGEEFNAKVWLRNAISQGNETAEALIASINQNGKSVFCRN